MITIHELPALRILIGLIAGVVLYPGYNMLPDWVLFLLIIMACIPLALSFTSGLKHRYRYLPSIYLFISTISLGLLQTWFADERNSPSHLNHFPELMSQKSQIIARCIDPPKKGQSWQVLMEGEAFLDSMDRWKSLTGKFIVFSKSFDRLPQPGEKFSIQAKLVEPPEREVPYAFDYKKYLENKYIYKISYIKESDIQLIKQTSFFNFKFIAFKIRNWCIGRCKLILGENEMADLASGLIFGYRDEIDESTQKAFVETGSVHLLAVSGMHVALIYINILFLLKLIGIRRLLGEKKMMLIAVSLIWVFTFVAGLSASVVRASLMLTILVVGKLFGRKGTGLNTVFSGAVLMIAFQPLVIYDVGFQLSFSAVLGIILLQHRVKMYLPPSFSKFKSLSDLITVTLAAQLGTIPLILYHFHQFPVYFLLSGIVAVFISDWVIKIGLAVVMISAFNTSLALYFGPLWELSVTALLKSVEGISRIPFGLVTGIYFSFVMATVLTGMLILTYIHIQKRVRYFGKVMLAGVMLLMFLDEWSLFVASKTENSTEMLIRNKQVTIIQKGLSGMIVADNRLDSMYVMNKVSGYLTASRIKDVKYQGITQNDIGHIEQRREISGLSE